MSKRSRLAVLAVALIGTVLAVTSGAAPANASRPAAVGSACSDPTGITVIVDFQELGGGVQIGCAAQPVDSGFDALTKAGFDVTRVTKFSGALCRIDGVPSDDPCINMPPANAYWSYWISARGGSWCYSNQGASRKPPKGTVEGWSFSKGKGASATPKPGANPPGPIPGTTPSTIGHSSCPSEPTTTTTKPPAPATTTTKAPAGTTATTPPSGGSGGGGSTDGSGGGASTDGGPGSSGTSPPKGTKGSTTTSSAPAGADGTTTSSIDGAVDGTTSSSASAGDDDELASGSVSIHDRKDGGGSPVGVGLAAGGVLVLGGGAIVTARRRRSADGPEV